MPDATNLYLFTVAALLLLIVPGPNMAFVISHAVAHGWRAGFAAALGITLADVLMTAMVSAGLGAVVMSWAPAFDLLRWAGACYLMWLAWQALSTPPADADAEPALASQREIFIRATLNSLLNPKALLFFMVFLPQFVTLGTSSVTLQLMVLGVLLALLALIFHSLLSVCAGRLHGRGRGGMISRRLGAYGFAIVMTALAARLLVLNRTG
ncbi:MULTISPECIES: LysE family translocator [Pseudomonas]|uniref:Threonine/homoserine/homoserine lactone efflux protein n=1 Tax=Pseudomonas migulae TaxID=78543 RepID=A0A1H5L9K8_9PSED|nr:MULTISPECIES: LysE family translocator [Pseudomonas]TWC50436.1 threonine/homoserine/homoserine lactone efflux protein [Pseudomonas sp. SJZ080]SEE73756.1 Threonine/homoserine/homoserine lactone efflux protein [Pseudomonas migulae]